MPADFDSSCVTWTRAAARAKAPPWPLALTGRHAAPPLRALTLAVSLALGAAPALWPSSALAGPTLGKGVAWNVASSDAEVDAAFAQARKTGKPVYLYWGAIWCPPCNQVKATLFNRPDFIERSRAFVPVYVDGDKPGAQKVASRFKVSGYPTMILFKPDGTEITRLPGEVDPERYLLTLTSGMDAQLPVRELARMGQAGQSLSPEQWRLLAFYSWDTDEQQVFKTDELAVRLAALAAAAPPDLPGVADRLAFKALVARTRQPGADGKPADGRTDESGRKLAERLLAQTGLTRDLSDLLVGYAEPVVKYLEPAGEGRRALAARWDVAVARAVETGQLSNSERLDALDSRVALWKFMDGGETLSPARRDAVQREISLVVAASRDRYERQAVIPGAGHILTESGLGDASDALLKDELPRAVAPYYHMLVLAGNAKKRGDTAAALQWYERAWQKSEGPATRIQWGTGFVNQLVDLAPADTARVGAAASGVMAQLAARSETFYERNQRSLQRMARKLTAWQGNDAARQKVVAGLKAQLARTCSKLPARDAGRDNCEKVFSAAAV